MRVLTLYRMPQFFADEFKCLELFEDSVTGINLEAALLMWRIPVNAGLLILSTRYSEELEVALTEGFLVRNSEDRILRERMRQDRTFLQERSQANPRPVSTDEIQSGIFRTSKELLLQ